MKYWILLTTLLSLSLSTLAVADEAYTFIVKKQDEKAQARKGWNLSDWLTQRDKNRTSDLWLAMHTPTPYEFSLGGDYRWLTDPQGEADHRFSATAYARIFGLKLEKEAEPSRFNGILNFRFFGLYQQGTNITAFLGMRSQTDPATDTSFRSFLYGVSGTLYLTHFAGVELEYRKYADGTFDPGGVGAGGTQTEANFFIDFRFLRIYGGILNTNVDPTRKKGAQLGAKIFF